MYNGEHSVTFSGNPVVASRNTWINYGLIPETRPTFDPPTMSYPKWISYSQPDYLGLDKNIQKDSIPVSKTASWTFISYHDKTAYNMTADPSTYNGTVDPDRLYKRLLRELHGRVWVIRLADEQRSGEEYYHRGLVEIEKWETQDHFSRVTLKITAEPYRFLDYLTGDNAYESAGGVQDYDIPMNTGVTTPIYLEFVTMDAPDTVTITYAAYDAITKEYLPIVLNLSNVANNTRIKIDGTNKTVTFGSGSNAMSIVTTMWCFPSLAVQTSGVHRIHFSTNKLSYVKVAYISRFI